MVIKVLLVASFSGSLTLAVNRDLITAVNTALNFASWWLLIRAQRQLRSEITPKLDTLEEAATQVLDSSMPGGKRHTDPPAK